MFEGPLHLLRPAPIPRTDSSSWSELRHLLCGGDDPEGELPPLLDLISAAVSLATGQQRKVLLPLGGTAAEFALVRSGSKVLVNHYGTDSIPEIFQRDRPVELRSLLEACTRAARALVSNEPRNVQAKAVSRVAERAARTVIRDDRQPQAASRVERRGGAEQDAQPDVAFDLGYRCWMTHTGDSAIARDGFADVHALLFDGELWVVSHGRRVELAKGPIIPSLQHMVVAVRCLVDAWQADRPLNVRMRGEQIGIGVRRDKSGAVAVTLRNREGREITLPHLDVPGASLPILRTVSELLRLLIHSDHAQARNLRVTGLRSEVRELRRVIKTRGRRHSFVNHDPERLRWADRQTRSHHADARGSFALHTRLRYQERWSAEIDGLDAAGTHLCGDRIVVTTQRMTMALGRDSGELLWSIPSGGVTSVLVGSVLLRTSGQGEIELVSARDGHTYASTTVTPRQAGPPLALFAGGGELPPMAIVAEGRQRLVAIDLRTGQPRWRFRSRGTGTFQLRRSGRVLLVTRGDGTLDALDAASGEVVWRYSDGVRFCLPVEVCQDVVIAAAGEPGGGAGQLFGFDQYSGQLLWRRELDAAPSAAPVSAGQRTVTALGGGRRGMLACFEATDGRLRWMREDVGLGGGGKAMSVDERLIVNAPHGRASALELHDGRLRWQRALSNPVADDVPRQLSPILRHGVLFVPAARVHVLRPDTGEPLMSSGTCDLVPDLLRVDERAWFYVAEESGHLRAYGPAQHLALVR